MLGLFDLLVLLRPVHLELLLQASQVPLQPQQGPQEPRLALLQVPVPQHRGFHTVAGLVLQHFGALPAVGDQFADAGWRFEIVDLDGRRIDKILATPLPDAEAVSI